MKPAELAASAAIQATEVLFATPLGRFIVALTLFPALCDGRFVTYSEAAEHAFAAADSFIAQAKESKKPARRRS